MHFVLPHTKFSCEIPPGTGIGYQFRLVVGGQSPLRTRALASIVGGKSVGYSPPVISKIGPLEVQLRGSDYYCDSGAGASVPTVFIGEKRCIVIMKHCLQPITQNFPLTGRFRYESLLLSDRCSEFVLYPTTIACSARCHSFVFHQRVDLQALLRQVSASK